VTARGRRSVFPEKKDDFKAADVAVNRNCKSRRRKDSARKPPKGGGGGLGRGDRTGKEKRRRGEGKGFWPGAHSVHGRDRGDKRPYGHRGFVFRQGGNFFHGSLFLRTEKGKVLPAGGEETLRL